MRRLLSKLHNAKHLLLVALVLMCGSAWARSFVVTATAYTSSHRETDSTPFITATGASTKIGVVALSRDLLRQIPYGSIVRIEDLSSNQRHSFGQFFKARNFVVEDTMNRRMYNKLDVWMPDYGTAIRFGKRSIKITVLRYGR